MHMVEWRLSTATATNNNNNGERWRGQKQKQQIREQIAIGKLTDEAAADERISTLDACRLVCATAFASPGPAGLIDRALE